MCMLLFPFCILMLFFVPKGSKLWFYCLNVCIAFDQDVNAALGGDHDETISARAGQARRRGSKFGTYLANFIDFIFKPLEKNHCENAIAFDAKRKIKYEVWQW